MMESALQEDPQNYKTTGVAVRMGDLVGLQKMVWSGRPVDVFDNRGWSPLHEAASRGFSGCLEFLLRQSSVDPDWLTHRNETPLLLAARYGRYQCLRALINSKASVNLMTNEGLSPLYEAIVARSNDCIRMLVKKGAVVNHVVYTGYTPLHQAASTGNAVVSAYLLQQGAAQNVRCHDGLTPLFLAVQSGSSDTVRVLLNRLPDPDDGEDDVVNIAADDNATPLLIAAQDGHDEIIDLLLHHGADPSIHVTDTKAGPLQYAIYCNRSKCVRKLLPVTDLLMFDSDFSAMHPLVLAVSKHSTDMLEELLNAGFNPAGTRPLDPDQFEEFQELSDGFVDAHWKASLLCHIPREAGLESARCLLSRGLSPNVEQTDELQEFPPLLAAIVKRNFPLFRLFLHYEASPNVYSQGRNITMLCALNCDLQNSAAFEILMRHSGDDNSNESSVSETDKYAWLEHSKRSFLINLFAAGGEVESLLRNTDSGRGLNAVLGLNLLQQVPRDPVLLEHRQRFVAALIGLLLCLSYSVDSLPADLLKLVSADQAKELTELAGNSGTLAHKCRQYIFRCLCTREQKMEEAVATFELPQHVEEYLLFPELQPYKRTLCSLMPSVQG